jgi:ketosteroid isomerase-like protein
MCRAWLWSGLLLLAAACASERSVGRGHRDRDKGLHEEHARRMTDRDDFLAWVKTSLYQAELALHNGDPAPRLALWSRREPVSVLGAWRNAHGRSEIDALFAYLGRSFSNCTSYAFEVQAYDVVGDMAYTAGLERTAVSVDGKPRTYTLRVTQVYRREDGAWKVVHRHGDTVTE